MSDNFAVISMAEAGDGPSRKRAPRISPDLDPRLRVRLMSTVSETTGCWVWNRKYGADGYTGQRACRTCCNVSHYAHVAKNRTAINERKKAVRLKKKAGGQ